MPNETRNLNSEGFQTCSRCQRQLSDLFFIFIFESLPRIFFFYLFFFFYFFFFLNVQDSSDRRTRHFDSRDKIENTRERFDTFQKFSCECCSQCVANSRSRVRYICRVVKQDLVPPVVIRSA